jgi:hypothetical protein
MSEDTINGNRGQMIDTTDCLEAVSVFRGWKNFFFLIVLVCLLIVQFTFWLVDTRTVAPPVAPAAGTPDSLIVPPATTTPAASDANSAIKSARPRSHNLAVLDWLTFDRLTRIVELVNGILIITATLFCMAMLFSLMVSLIGRLGGINHIARAFFLSLIMAVLVMPWQKMLGMNVPGVVYAPAELVTWLGTKSQSTLSTGVYYLRFVGYWLIVVLLLMLSQLRSARWTKAILRRLEII